MQGDVVEEGEFEADGDDLAELSDVADALAAGAEAGEGLVAGAGELDAVGGECSVEIERGTELDLDAELELSRGEGAAVEDPAAAVVERGGEGGQKVVPFLVGEGLDVEREHGSPLGRRKIAALGCSSDGHVWA